MANGFNHKDLINTLQKNFIKLFKKYISPSLQDSISWVFPDEDFEHAYASGSGHDQVINKRTVFAIASRKIHVDFIEDYMGNLTIMVDNRIVYVVKPMEGVSKDLLKALANSIKDMI